MKYILSFLFILSCTSSFKQESKSRLDKIIESKKLIVATTGDYAPFSYKDSSGEFSGIDVEFSKNLANSLGVKLEFYQTSWKSLMTDLKANRFDIAMSGISKKLSRQKVGLFTKGYIENGKMGISRCRDVIKYNSLKKIDRSNVRLIVNPGGTNEKFVLDNIKKASVIKFADNNYIFDEIIKNNADVMITDSVEVAYQVKKSSGKLCATMKNTLTTGEIAYLLPRDIIWKEYLDSWLHILERNGDKKRILKTFINYK